MLPLLMLLCLMPVKAVQKEESNSATSHQHYLQPRYPSFAARAGLNADFVLELQIEKGGVKKFVLFVHIWDRMGGIDRQGFQMIFMERITQALEDWHSEMEDGSLLISIGFRSFITNHVEGKPSYYIYRLDNRVEKMVEVENVNDGGFYVPTMPQKILIEYHSPIPEGGDIMPRIKKWYWPF